MSDQALPPFRNYVTPEAEDKRRGIRCPQCNCGHCPVYYTRHREAVTVRMRECRACGHRFTTHERGPLPATRPHSTGGTIPPAE
jgi:uncharacterized protein (DUF983 family)